MPDVILVDDEPLARQGMRQMLAAHRDVRIVGEAGSAAQARALIGAVRPDAVFLDIEMADASGLDLAQHLDNTPAIIFVTAHAAHAVEAFAVAAVDYLLKPVRPERLAEALRRLAERRSAPRPAGAGLLHLKTRGRMLALRWEALVALCAEGDYARVFPADAPSLLVGQSLGELAAALPQPPFIRLGRSLMINGDRPRELQPVSRDETRLRLHGHAESFILGRAATLVLKRASGPAGG